MAGNHIAKFHTPKDKEIVLGNLLNQVNQNFDNQHYRQLMALKHDTDHWQHNPSDPSSITSIDCKLVTREEGSILSVTMQDEDHADITNKLATMVGSDHNTVQGFINDMVGKKMILLWSIVITIRLIRTPNNLQINWSHQCLSLHYIGSQRWWWRKQLKIRRWIQCDLAWRFQKTRRISWGSSILRSYMDWTDQWRYQQIQSP